MPPNVVHNRTEEKYWNEAKKQAEKQGKKNNYAYIMAIYEAMIAGHRKKVKERKMAKASTAHKSPPKGYPTDPSMYADPKGFRYPLDTEKHVRAAMAYFSKPKNADMFPPSMQRAMWRRMLAAAKKYGIDVSMHAGPPGIQKSLEDATKETLDFLSEAVTVLTGAGAPKEDE